MDPKSSVVFVTGSNRGLGFAIVKELLNSGVPRIYAGVRDPEKFRPPVFDDQRISPIGIDVTDAEAILKAAAAATDVTVLVNNAGVLEFGGALDVSEASMERSLSANLLGPLLMARAFVPVMERNGGGTIVNILSLLSLTNEPSFSSYCASKFASWSMTQSLRHELKDRNIKVVAVFPGGIDTDMLAGINAQKATPSSVAQRILEELWAGKIDIYPDPVSAAFRKM